MNDLTPEERFSEMSEQELLVCARSQARRIAELERKNSRLKAACDKYSEDEILLTCPKCKSLEPKDGPCPSPCYAHPAEGIPHADNCQRAHHETADTPPSEPEKVHNEVDAAGVRASLEFADSLNFATLEGTAIKRLAAEVRRLQRIEPSWRPIESAPKDGTHFLGCVLGKGGFGKGQDWSCVVHWFDDGWYASVYGDEQYLSFTHLTHWTPIHSSHETGGSLE